MEIARDAYMEQAWQGSITRNLISYLLSFSHTFFLILIFRGKMAMLGGHFNSYIIFKIELYFKSLISVTVYKPSLLS